MPSAAHSAASRLGRVLLRSAAQPGGAGQQTSSGGARSPSSILSANGGAIGALPGGPMPPAGGLLRLPAGGGHARGSVSLASAAVGRAPGSATVNAVSYYQKVSVSSHSPLALSAFPWAAGVVEDGRAARRMR
eukprot:359081-Chlamydomonas_euryale.AAC.8